MKKIIFILFVSSICFASPRSHKFDYNFQERDNYAWISETWNYIIYGHGKREPKNINNNFEEPGHTGCGGPEHTTPPDTAPAPEPATMLLCATGVAGLWLSRRRKQS